MARKFYETKNIRQKGRREKTSLLTENAFEEAIKDICKLQGPEDVEIILHKDEFETTICIERSFAAGATLYIRPEINWSEIFYGQDDDQKWYVVRRASLKFEINWSGTSRSLASAASAAQLYEEIICLGNNIRSVLDDYHIGFLTEATEKELEEIQNSK